MTVFGHLLTSKTNEEQPDDAQARLMHIVANVLAAIAMIGVMYQLTVLLASERESGMIRLLAIMLPNQAYWKTQVARLGSYHLAFTLLYSPGWILIGVIQGLITFRETSIIVLVTSNFLCGLSLTSMSVLIGTLLRKAQFSGVLTLVLALILAILAQVFWGAGKWGVAATSLFFAPMNYVYTAAELSLWEVRHRRVNLLKGRPVDHFPTPILGLWLFAVLQTISYLILGAVVERLLYKTDSNSRTINVSSSEVAIDLKSISKTYRPSLIQRLFGTFVTRPPLLVHAVHDLNLQAIRGEIMVLLGANKSGKSTTVDAVAGLRSVSSGKIMINYPSDSRCSFGYCPQKNVLWEELTVIEHIEIFEALKNVGRVMPGAEDSLANSCGLGAKTSALAKTLSEGQRRQLQMALMLAGGSSICCVDEVSSGVDSLERTKLWDILLAERGKRTIFLTTHSFNEAEMLADHIAILSGGSLKAYGTPVQLKHQRGIGYRVHLYEAPDELKQPFYGDVLHNKRDEETVYFTGTSTETHDFLKRLEGDGISNYYVKGPTLEDVFLRIEVEASGDTENPTQGSQIQQRSRKTQYAAVNKCLPVNPMQSELLYGRNTSSLTQMSALLSKRLIIFRENSLLYLSAVTFTIVAAAFATILLQDTIMASCNPEMDVGTLNSTTSSSIGSRLMLGRKSRHSSVTLAKISGTPLVVVTCVETISQFINEVRKKCSHLIPSGFFLGKELTFACRADGSLICGTLIQNLLDSTLSNVTITSSYEPLDTPLASDTGDLLMITTYFCLAMAVYPAFFAMYPTIERLKGVRIIHYSNGVRPLPLWFSYLIFDFSMILPVSFIGAMVFSAVANTWCYIPYTLLMFTLYSMAALLFSYLVSMFATSRLAAFATTACVQSAIYIFNVFIFVVTMTYVNSSLQSSVLSISCFTLGAVSPVCSLGWALYVTLNIYGANCCEQTHASCPPALEIYGSPILYLIVQSLILFALLVWVDSRVSFKGCHSRKAMKSTEQKTIIDLEQLKNKKGAPSNIDGLHDNPSSGIYVTSKPMRRTISSTSPSCSLGLTTHSMEQGDLLASYTCLLPATTLALETIKESRQKHGNGYVIDLVHKQAPHPPAHDMEIVNWWMLRQFPNAKHQGSIYHGQARFEILSDDEYGDISRIMEVAKVEVGVHQYSIRRVTLD